MARKLTLFVLAACILTLAAAPPPPQGYDALRREAERFYAEKSFSRAHEIYEQAAKLDLPPEERRWVAMRLADTAWRSAPDDRDETTRKALEAMVAEETHDRVWAEANESVGDYHLQERRGRNIYQAIQYYNAALDFWAGSDDLELARRRYLSIAARITEQPYYVQMVPRDVLVNALSIARTADDRARFRFYLATQLMYEGRPESVERALEHFEAIIAEGKKTEWYDDALFMAAQLLTQERGNMQVLANGQVDSTTDYERALGYYRRIITELRKDETPHYEQAKNAIDQITKPNTDVATAGTFLPESEQEVIVSWRNVKSIELSITAVDLTAEREINRADWLTATAGKTPLRTWTFTPPDRGPYRPGSERIRIEPALPPGAYVVQAGTGKALLLVSDAHIVMQSTGQRMQVFVSDVLTGAPIAKARVVVWQQTDNKIEKQTGETNANGLAMFESRGENGGSTWITAAAGPSRQAWLQTYRYWYNRDGADPWRIYAFTDRPAYRPDETVQWKIIARVRKDERWITPANQTLTYEITNPRGEKVSEGKATLNAFGSFWSELPLTSSMPLGQYTITFKQGNNVGYASLFRLEEYKLPEFQVSVSTPEGKQYRLGDTIEAQVEATYYFGGPVANATVEAVVYQQPFFRPWYPWRKYPWYFPVDPSGNQGSMVLKRETLTTDANGRATIRIDTSRDGRDAIYRIEARVVDASRREVRGEGEVRVMRQRYSAQLQPEHMVHRPGEQVSVEIRAIDANDQPVTTTGTVTVFRRTSKGDEEVMSTEVATNASGEATFTFTPKREGFYAIRWRSEDRDPDRPLRARDIVTAETTIWVAERRTTDIGWHTPGLDLVIDKESFKQGEKVSAILVTPASGRWVVVTAVADEILETQVVHLDGTVKLVEFATDERHVPNFFITAVSIFDRAIATDTERVVVPPVEQFLDVEVKSDREDYRPREEATVTVTTRDHTGKPVPAEVALSVSDEAVTAIQQDLAGDPRQFFYGDLREQRLQLSAGLHSQRFIKLIERDGRLIDADAPEARDEEERRKGERDGAYGYGVVGGVAGDLRAQAMPAPPPAPVPTSAVAEAITVTQNAPRMMAKEQAANVAAPMQVEVRSDFRSTAFWKPDIVTNQNGTASVKVKMPEALTTWRATARAATAGSQFGFATDTSKTNLPLIVRLQAPRFFVVGDRTTISAVINNNTDAAMPVTPAIEVKGLNLRDASNAAINVPAHGEARADWVVTADVAGPATIRVTGRGAQHGDAMEKTFTVFEHGIDKLIARSGKMRADEVTIKLDLPAARRATELSVHVSPTLGDTMVAALPYLIAFPYGCTEQTMSRFLPAAVVAKTGLATGIKNLDEVTRAGMARLYDMQHADGSWGWWKEGPNDDWMTAYVVWGFSIARDAGLPVRKDAVDRAAAYLQQRLVVHEREPNDQAWMLHALSAWRKTAGDAEKRAFERVWTARERLSSYSRALLALTAHRYGDVERAKVLVRNLENGVKVDDAPDRSVLIGNTASGQAIPTAHWGASGFWWRWHEAPVETTAFVLQALVNIEPNHRLIEPAMNWLIKNRRGAQWSNTRDTAIAVLALNDYLKASGELKNDVAYEVTVNGRAIGSGSGSKTFALPFDQGQPEIRIRRTSGTGPLYFGAEARFVSLEEPVKAAGNELFVRRDYYRLAPKPTLLKGVVYDKVPLRDGDSIKSGERVEVVIGIETKNDYSYLMFEDLKPAGLEAVELLSGANVWATDAKNNRSAFVYQELRDRKVALFIDHLQQGIWEVRYTMRAEVPGTFHALPVIGQAMYVPDIRGNGDEVRITVTE